MNIKRYARKGVLTMTDRARTIQEGKRERALKALENENRKRFFEGFILLVEEEAQTLLKWLKELTEKKDINSYYGLAGGPHGVCPKCCTSIPRILGQEIRFCPFCGQGVNWRG